MAPQSGLCESVDSPATESEEEPRNLLMKLPADAVISIQKLRDYLLTLQSRGDKSRFLAQAGYTRANPWELERDLRGQILPLDAMLLPAREYGDRYEIRGKLHGPNGMEIPVRTIWMRESETGVVKFITLIPLAKERA